MSDKILAIDIGGSHIKAVLIDENGEILKDRIRLATPKPATPDAVMEVIVKLAAGFEGFTKAAAGFPGICKEQYCANGTQPWHIILAGN